MAFDIIVGRTEEDKERFGKNGIVLLGKSYVKMGRNVSLSNPLYLDIAKSHVVLICGKRGSGKCLLGDTLIPLNDGSLIPIEKLEEDNFNVMSLNENLKIEETNKSEFFSRGVEKIIKLKLRSGREIKLTPEHPLLTIKGWKATEELNIGSRIATARKIDCFGQESIENYKTKLLAYFIAEGYFKKAILFSNSDEEIITDFEDSLKLFDSKLILRKDKEYHYRIVEKDFKNKILNFENIKRNEKGQFCKNIKLEKKKRNIRLFLEKHNLFGKGSLERYIPQKIFRLNKRDLSLFLNRLFSCDGSIYYNKSRNGWEIDYSSSSKKLIYQVQHLLLRFGILSKIRNKKIKYNGKLFKSYEIVIGSENIKTFIEEIGFFGEKKIKQEICLEEIKDINRNPNVDTIPKELCDIYKPNNWAEIGRFCGYAHPKAMRERINYCPSRNTLMQVGLAEQNKALINLAQSDVFWDEIVSMELLEGKFKVYDICVPELHNFIANDIIVHNSYSQGVISEGVMDLPEDVKENLSVILMDTMGVFWTMKYENKKDEDLLDEWELDAKKMDIDIYVPKGHFNELKEKGLPIDYSFAIKPKILTAVDWCSVFNVEVNSDEGVLISRVINKLQGDYGLADIMYAIEEDGRSEMNTKNAIVGMFQNAMTWGLFDPDAIDLKKISSRGRISVVDLSSYSSMGGNWNIKALVLGLISKKILTDRIISRKKEELEMIEKGFSYFNKTEIESEMPMVWMFIDEAHEFLPRDKKTAATDALISLLREGRQPGISLVLATQQPGKIHDDVITQSDIVLCHRITAKQDIDALNAMMQSYMNKGLTEEINTLPREKGAAVVLDDTSERVYPIRVRPRLSWHGGEAPSAVKTVGKEIEF